MHLQVFGFLLCSVCPGSVELGRRRLPARHPSAWQWHVLPCFLAEHRVSPAFNGHSHGPSCCRSAVVGVSLDLRLVPCGFLALAAYSWCVLLLAWIRCSRRPWSPFPSTAEMAAAACAGVAKVTKANPFRFPVSWSIGKLVSVSGLNFPSSVSTSSSVVE